MTTTPEGARRGLEARARLLRAAVTSFAERGFHATTTRHIAAAAGMSPAAVYVHHRSKEDLLYSIALDGHRETLSLVRDAIASENSPAAQLRAVVRALTLHHAEKNLSGRVVNYELSALESAHYTEIRELRRRISAEVRGLVHRGVADGTFRCEAPEIAVTAVLSLCIDVARWYTREGEWTPTRLADTYADMAIGLVGGH